MASPRCRRRGRVATRDYVLDLDASVELRQRYRFLDAYRAGRLVRSYGTDAETMLGGGRGLAPVQARPAADAGSGIGRGRVDGVAPARRRARRREGNLRT